MSDITIVIQQPDAMTCMITPTPALEVTVSPGNTNANWVVSELEPVNPPNGLVWIKFPL
jgi:hypothetical protein